MEEKDAGWKGSRQPQQGAGVQQQQQQGLGGGMVNQTEAFKSVLATAQDGMGGLGMGSGEGRAGDDDNLASSATRQKVAAAKQYIENHYKSQMKSLQERKERYTTSS